MEDNQIPVVPVILAIFVIVGLVLLVGMFVLFGFLIARAAKRRSYDTARGQQMQQAANQIGWSFQPQAELSVLPSFTKFELFEGDPLKFENLLSGNLRGDNAFLFDLVYRNVGSKGGTTTSRQTMLAVIRPNRNLPEFYLRPEGIFEKVLNAVSRVDIDFPEHPAFSQKFLLYGKNEAGIRHIFSPQNLAFFEHNPNICVFGENGSIFMYQSRTLAAPQQLGQFIAYFGQINDLFPAGRF